MSTTESEVLIDGEFARLVGWRERELRRAGYDELAARALAERTEVDLHRATDLPKAGCPHETALRILL